MREWLAYTLIALILLSFVVSEYVDTSAEHEFFDEMREHHTGAQDVLTQVEAFIQAGGRNTSDQGRALCRRVEALEKQHEAQHHSTCAEIYGRDK